MHVHKHQLDLLDLHYIHISCICKDKTVTELTFGLHMLGLTLILSHRL